MNICGECSEYRVLNNGQNYCHKTKKVTGYLQQKECFTPKDTKMDITKLDIKKIDDTYTTDTEQVKTKVCKRCGRELPLHEFGRHARTADGLQVYCRECSKQAMMRTRRAKVEKDKKRATYGLASYETDDLINELRRRGLSGYLKQVVEISV